jgi:hypothetical protein
VQQQAPVTPKWPGLPVFRPFSFFNEGFHPQPSRPSRSSRETLPVSSHVFTFSFLLAFFAALLPVFDSVNSVDSVKHRDFPFTPTIFPKFPIKVHFLAHFRLRFFVAFPMHKTYAQKMCHGWAMQLK